MRLFAIAILALCLMLWAVALSHASTPCFADADGVRHHSPGAWPSWTRRMKGHRGEKCWFPTVRKHFQVAQPVEQAAVNRPVAGSNPALEATPLPRPRLGTEADHATMIAELFHDSPAGKDAGNDKGNSRLGSPKGLQSSGTSSSEADDKTVQKTVQAGASPATSKAIPLPRPRLAGTFVKAAPPTTPFSDIERLWEALMRARELSPKGRVESGFEGMGRK